MLRWIRFQSCGANSTARCAAFRRALGGAEKPHWSTRPGGQVQSSGAPSDLRAALESGIDLDAAARKALASNAPRRSLAELAYAPLVPEPGKIVCLGLNYLDHVKEGPQRDNIPKYQSIFFRMPTSLTPHLQPLMRPKKSIQLDYEGEMIVVIGKRAKHLTLDNAIDCVAGYACGMEGSVREYQRHTTQWGMGKNFDRTGSVGPWMVTADALPKGGKGLKIETRLNQKVMQSANTDLLMFPVAESLVYLTEGMTLEPGDILFTGTPSGVGHARKPEPVWMKAGDVAEVEIEGIGTLRNPIEDEKL